MTARTVAGDGLVVTAGAAEGQPAVVLSVHHSDDPPGAAPTRYWLEPAQAARLLADLASHCPHAGASKIREGQNQPAPNAAPLLPPGTLSATRPAKRPRKVTP